MAKSNGFFTLHRRLFEDVLWLSGTLLQKSLMILCIGKAGFKQNEWIWEGKKFNAKRGQFITSLDSFKKELGRGATIQKIRTSLDNLEKYGFLANESTKTGRLITIVNYSKYQDIKKKVTKKTTKKQQRGNKEVTPTNNDNNGNNDNNKEKIYKKEYKSYVHLYEKEYQKLVKKYGEDKTLLMIEVLDNYKGAKPSKRTYTSDYKAILSWVVDKVIKQKEDWRTT